ncbi:CENP-Q, a CENPA-CAD centromere complex subunit-domain-containing protein [Lipomyces tetrasporus]|uniref:CENP-Q, a CENPA-CAD centromere complex subunit-domain-containing protein n=1 Tax=Lipomyces tetrasporus TaxID=54092 RepID=A0AAD7VT81_9ASCO|nr:CENP-Q, a CENPA-CAD centromere complex subunit-domain-containing protein [Lipomyces tetrasporus]KAJ8099880.1 CENP-Q, a CENPA-CAD centromere complex subunit-domain-containing protein [Lipomyces tetrasporus]
MAKSARPTKVKKPMRPSRQASKTTAADASKVSKVAKLAASANRRAEGSTASDNRAQQSRTGPKVRRVVRRVRARVIQNDWVQLSETAREEVMKVMQASSLAVYNSVTGEEKKKEVQEVVGSVLSKMERRLRRLPVPPTTKDRNFQYERMLELNVALEADLVTDLQQVAELEAEITAEQNELEKDTEYLQTLKHNAKSHEMLRGSQKKKLDKLLKEVSNVTPTNDDAESINLMDTSIADPQITTDNDLKMLIFRLGSHLTSIRNNIVGLEGVLAATRQVERVLTRRSGRGVAFST